MVGVGVGVYTPILPTDDPPPPPPPPQQKKRRLPYNQTLNVQRIIKKRWKINRKSEKRKQFRFLDFVTIDTHDTFITF